MVDYTLVVIELFRYLLRLRHYRRKSVELRSWRFSKGGGSIWTQILQRRERRSPTTVGVRISEWLPFSCSIGPRRRLHVTCFIV